MRIAHPSATYALVVGIRDYDSFPGDPVRGAVNDALRWVRFLVRHLAVPGENIQVRTSGLSTAEREHFEALGVVLGGAAAGELEDAIVGMRRQVIRHPGSNAVFTYSGHGTTLAPMGVAGVDGSTLTLCPQDLTPQGQRYQNALPFARFQDLWAGSAGEPTPSAPHDHPALGGRLTMILDTCYVPAGLGQRGLPPAPRPITRPAADGAEAGQQQLPSLALFERVMMAARQGETAKELRVQDKWYGAFTFALTTLAEQWQQRRRGAVNFLDVSHEDLMFRTRELVSLLGVRRQIPSFAGFAGLNQVAVFDPDSAVYIGGTSAAPNVKHGTSQLSPNDSGYATYAFSDSNNVTFAIAVVTGVAATQTKPSYEEAFPAGQTEYWYCAASLPKDGTISVMVTPNVAWPDKKGEGDPMLDAALAMPSNSDDPVAVSWTSSGVPTEDSAWCGDDDAGNRYGLQISAGPTARWFRVSDTGEAPTGLLFAGLATGSGPGSTILQAEWEALDAFGSGENDVWWTVS